MEFYSYFFRTSPSLFSLIFPIQTSYSFSFSKLYMRILPFRRNAYLYEFYKNLAMRISKKLLLVLVLFIPAIFVHAQEVECKVLMDNIQSSYEGQCKNHLAHGNGTARGLDTYTGSFKKGYPNGKGTYKSSTGEYYEGEWVMGQREGIGEYNYTILGKDAKQVGVWKSDKYLGPKPVPPIIKLS